MNLFLCLHLKMSPHIFFLVALERSLLTFPSVESFEYFEVLLQAGAVLFKYFFVFVCLVYVFDNLQLTGGFV